MAEELDKIIEEPSESQKRITDLSGKVRQTAEERDAAKKSAEEATQKAAEAEKRAAFAEGFADILSNQPAAKDHKADIQAKVMAGYSLEDATFAVLGKAGKLGASAAPPPPISTPAGGSATIAPPQSGSGNKSYAQMSQEERRNALFKAQDNGDLSLT